MNWGKRQTAEFLDFLVTRYEGQLVHFTASKLGGDRGRAQELVQEAFLRFWKEQPQGELRALAGWLFTVCRNLAVDHCRKDSRLAQVPTEVLAEQYQSSVPGALEALEANEERWRLSDALARLKPKHQEVLRLRIQSGLSYREISAATGLTVSNVGYLLHEALEELQALMDEGIPEYRTAKGGRP